MRKISIGIILCTCMSATCIAQGNVGIGTSNPQPYGHGGTNKFIEIQNTQTGINSQSHVILASAGSGGSLGTITWANTAISSGTEQRTGLVANFLQESNSSNPNTGLGFYTRNSVTGLVEQVRISSLGNVGIGITNPNFKLDVGARMRLRATPGEGAGIWLNNEANTTIPALIGMKSDTEVGFFGSLSLNNNWRFYVNTISGNAWLQGTLTQNSDARLKKDIIPLSNTLASLQQLSGYSYFWKDASNPEEQIGLLAQELQKVYPQLVRADDKGTLSVNYSGMVPVLLEAIKEQQKQSEMQNKRNEELQSKIEKQQKELDELKKLVQHLINSKQ